MNLVPLCSLQQGLTWLVVRHFKMWVHKEWLYVSLSLGHSWKHDTWNALDETVSGDFDPFTGLTLFDLSEKDVYDPPPLPEVDMATSAHAPRSLQVPQEPTPQERAEHELTHLPQLV